MFVIHSTIRARIRRGLPIAGFISSSDAAAQHLEDWLWNFLDHQLINLESSLAPRNILENYFSDKFKLTKNPMRHQMLLGYITKLHPELLLSHRIYVISYSLHDSDIRLTLHIVSSAITCIMCCISAPKYLTAERMPVSCRAPNFTYIP